MMDHPQRFAAETSKPRSAGATLGRLWRYFRPYSLALLLVALLIIGSTYMQILIPNLTGQAVDCYLTPFTTARAAGDTAGSGLGELLAAATSAPRNGGVSSQTRPPHQSQTASPSIWATMRAAARRKESGVSRRI